MGWTGIHAENYRDGKVDRKAECDRLWDDDPKFVVLESAMRGTVWYGAVKTLKKRVETKTENGYEREYVDIPESEQEVFAAIVLTHVDNNDWFNFTYKEMDETCGPGNYDCPKKILKLLTPTENEHAIAWREKCSEKGNKKRMLGRLPLGTHIKVILNGVEKEFVKSRAWGKNAVWLNVNGRSYITSQTINQIGYTIVQV